jgi:MerR family Zn(II)-responsive transcriptional regulator of zntA
MHVNELAKTVGVPAHVVRYYTQAGLLKPHRDNSNRYRQYAKSDTDRLRFIRCAKSLGFTLADTKAILNDADQGQSPCAEVRRLIKLRASENRKRLEELTHLQERMDEALAVWESMPDHPPGHHSLCHLIDAMSMAKEEYTSEHRT